MRALVKLIPGVGMIIQNVSVPTIGSQDVLIRLLCAGLRQTDIHVWEWDSWARSRLKPPVIIGHELSGVIEKIGPEAAGFGMRCCRTLTNAVKIDESDATFP